MKINATLACDCSTTEYAIIGLGEHENKDLFSLLLNRIYIESEDDDDGSLSYGVHKGRLDALKIYGTDEPTYIGIDISDDDDLKALKDEFVAICKTIGITIDKKELGFYNGTVGQG